MLAAQVCVEPTRYSNAAISALTDSRCLGTCLLRKQRMAADGAPPCSCLAPAIFSRCCEAWRSA